MCGRWLVVYLCSRVKQDVGLGKGREERKGEGWRVY